MPTVSQARRRATILLPAMLLAGFVMSPTAQPAEGPPTIVRLDPDSIRYCPKPR